MKTFKTVLAVVTAVLLGLAILSAPASAALGSPDGNDVASLYQSDPNDKSIKLNPPFEEGQQIQLYANFDNGTRLIKFYKKTASTGWTQIGSKQSSSSGNATIPYTIDAGLQQLYAEDPADEETEVDDVTGTTSPSSTTATLDPPTNGGKTWTAHFGGPAVPGKATQLQIQRIYTDEVDDVDAVNPEKKKAERVGPWKTIATSTQNASGDSTFNLSSPYPYRVEHRYRAVSGTAESCEQLLANAPTTCQKFGLPQTTPKSTGLSAVYFNTNEGHAVDTRTRYFEGEFSMTADGRSELNCAAVPNVKFSVMKGRGNYSWSFKRKSYTLKLGSKKDLCGMGEGTKYALVSQDYDKSFLRNALAGFVGKKFNNMAWTPDSTPVDFYLNGKYLGNYLLIERIAIDPNRVAIDELKGGEPCGNIAETPEDQATDPNHPNNNQPCITGGYILEWDFRKGADKNVTAGGRGWVGIKDPEHDRSRENAGNAITNQGISPQQVNYIDDYLGDADAALSNAASSNAWKNYIDMDSAVDYYLAMEYMKPVDGNMWASVYMYKPRGGKLHFGPMWDFDLAAGSANRAGNVVSPSSWYLRNNLQVSAMQPENSTTKYNTWFNQLNKNEDFRDAARARWNAVSSGMNVSGFLDDQKAIIEDSANTSFSSSPSSHSYRISQYQVIKSSWSADVSYLRSWASSRKSWMSSQF